MTPDERRRHRLYDRAVEVLGEEEAHELMAKLPPTPWPDLATKQDFQHEFGLLRSELQHEAQVLRTEIQQEAKTLRGELQQEATALRGELQQEATALRSELQHEAKVLRTEMVSMEHRITAAFHRELREAISGQTKAYIAWTGGLMALLATMTTVASR